MVMSAGSRGIGLAPRWRSPTTATTRPSPAEVGLTARSGDGRCDAVVLLRCAETGWSYWAWTGKEWAGLLGRDQDSFRQAAPLGG
jgi:hypothetical protein